MIRSQGTIVTMASLDESRIAEVCELLVHSFRDLSPTWVPTVAAARAKVIAGQDPFVDVIAALRDLKPTGAHPLGFWQRVGYTVVGVIPDAEGPGKPTILLAKRIRRDQSSGLPHGLASQSLQLASAKRESSSNC